MAERQARRSAAGLSFTGFLPFSKSIRRGFMILFRKRHSFVTETIHSDDDHVHGGHDGHDDLPRDGGAIRYAARPHRATSPRRNSALTGNPGRKGRRGVF